jgi:hypothetical protein
MEIPPVDERDFDRRVPQPHGRLEPAEPAADDHDAMQSTHADTQGL